MRLPFATFIARSVLVAVRPAHVFRTIAPSQTLSWPLAAAVIMAMTFVDASLHYRMVFGGWIWQHRPEWLPLTAGWGLFNLNQWLLAMLALRALHALLRGQVARPGIDVAAYYLLGGLWTLSFTVDALHPLLHLRPVELHMPWFAWLDRPIFGNPARVSWLVMFPWAAVALTLILRHVLGITGRRLWVGAALAVVLPVAGRMVIEPLPNFVIHAWGRWLGWRPPGGWVVLGTHAVLALAAGACVRAAARRSAEIR